MLTFEIDCPVIGQVVKFKMEKPTVFPYSYVTVILKNPVHGYEYSQSVCKGGQTTGEVVTATAEHFEAACQSWHNSRLELCQKQGIQYAG